MNCRPLTIFLIFTYSIYVLLKSNGVATLPIRYRLGNCPTVKLKWSPSFDDVTKMYSIFFPLGKGCIAILWVTHTNITICIASFFQHSFCNVCSVNDKVNANHMSKKLCPHFFSLILFVLFLHLFSIFSRSCFFLYLSIYVPFMWCIDRVVRLMGQSYTHTHNTYCQFFNNDITKSDIVFSCAHHFIIFGGSWHHQRIHKQNRENLYSWAILLLLLYNDELFSDDSCKFVCNEATFRHNTDSVSFTRIFIIHYLAVYLLSSETCFNGGKLCSYKLPR